MAMRARATAIAAMIVASACSAEGPSAPVAPPLLIEGSFSAERQPDGNSIIFEDEDGLVVIDTGRHREHQVRILQIAARKGKPIRAIVNTHWHLDHSGGNAEIRARHPKAKLYASNAVAGALDGFLARSLASAKPRLDDPSLSAAEKAEIQLGVGAIEDRRNLLPDVAVTGKTDLPLSDRTLELHLAPRAATAGDLWIWDPVTRTLIAGDLVVIPAPFFDTGCAQGWREALGRLASVPFETLIPGHGKPMTRDEFNLYRTAFDRLVECGEGSSPKQRCTDGWKRDAGRLLSEQDRKDAQMLLDYYVDAILRSAEKKAEFCGA
jgi:glyoxylase-like metal-dependent hydrolase (beta-lactamase superfamily II)